MFCAYMQACCLCDGYAATFLLDKVDAYASAENVPTEKVRQKREIGIYFALFAMTLIGARHWRSSERTGCNLSKEYGDTPCPRSGRRSKPPSCLRPRPRRRSASISLSSTSAASVTWLVTPPLTTARRARLCG